MDFPLGALGAFQGVAEFPSLPVGLALAVSPRCWEGGSDGAVGRAARSWQQGSGRGCRSKDSIFRIARS